MKFLKDGNLQKKFNSSVCVETSKMPRSEVRRQTTFHTKPQYPVSIKPQGSLVPSVPLTTPSFGQVLKEGIGFGAGSAIGHRIVGAVLGAPSTPVSTSTAPPTLPVEAPSGKCTTERKAFELCLKTKSDDQCNNEILSYKQCIELS